MKKFITLVALVLSLNVSAGQWFRVQGNCLMQGGVTATCQACNTMNFQNLYCKMLIQGQSLYGTWVNGTVENFVAPRQCMSGHVTANNPFNDPIVSANVQVFCRF